MEEIRTFLSVSASSEFDIVAPHIANAERDYLVPVIGAGLYDRLTAFYNAGFPDGLDEVHEKTAQLLIFVQSAVIHIAYWIGFDVLNSVITDTGFKRTESTTVKGLYKYQEENLKNYLRTSGFNGLDTVLQYLEINLDDFEEFSASPAFSLLKTSFIPTTYIFNDIVFINNSRLTFLRMKSHIRLIEDTEIAPILGPAAYEYIKAELAKPTPASKVLAILPYIRKPLAYLASAMLMEESGADLTDNGLYFTSISTSYPSDTNFKPASPDRIAILVTRNRDLGNAYLDLLRGYLSANTSAWTEVAPSTGKLFRRNNTDKKTFWA